MSEFWTTVLSTAGASAIISGVITSVASILLQHRYDEKIESFKADLSKMLNEDQTRFNLWYQEKAEAIKILYKDFSETYYLLQHLVSVETDSSWQQDAVDKKKEEDETLKQLAICAKTSFRKWLHLRLYLDDNDNSKIRAYFSFEVRFVDSCKKRLSVSDIEYFIRNKDEICLSLSSIMDELRMQFRETLIGQSDIVSIDQGKDSAK